MSLERNITLLKWHTFLGSLCFYAAVMFIYYVGITESYALAASVFSISLIAAMVFEIPTGVLSDRFGRKSVLILSSLSALAALGFFAFADGYPMLVIGAILDGLAFALASGNNDALLHDTLKELGREEEYAARRGEIGFWHQVALSAAVLGGSFFVGISLSLVFQLALIPLSAALLLAFFVKEPAIRGHLQSNAYAHIGEALSLIRGNTRLNLLVSGRALTEAYWRAKTPLMPAFFLMLWPLWAIGIAKSLGHAGSALGMKSVGYFVKRYGREKMALWSEGAVFGIGTFVLAVPSFFSPLINPLATFFAGLGSVTENAMLQREYADTHRATLGSLVSFAGTLLGAALTFLTGLFADRMGLLPALLLLQVLLLPILLFYFLLWRQSLTPRSESSKVAQ